MDREKEYKVLLYITTFLAFFFSFFSLISAALMATTSLFLYKIIKRRKLAHHASYYVSLLLLIYSSRAIIVFAISFIIIFFNLTFSDYNTLNIRNDYFQFEYNNYFSNISAQNIEMTFLNRNNTFEFYDIKKDVSKGDLENVNGIYFKNDGFETYYYLYDGKSNNYFVFKSESKDVINNYFLQKEVLEVLKTIEFFQLNEQDIVIDKEEDSRLYGFVNMFSYEVLNFWSFEEVENSSVFKLHDFALLDVSAFTVSTDDESEIVDRVVQRIGKSLILNQYEEVIGSNNYHVFETIRLKDELENTLYLYIPEGSSSFGMFDFYIKSELSEDDQIFVDANVRYILNSLNDEFSN